MYELKMFNINKKGVRTTSFEQRFNDLQDLANRLEYMKTFFSNFMVSKDKNVIETNYVGAFCD